MREQIKLVIPLAPITKKNSQQIIFNKKTGRPMILPSAKYRQYENEAGHLIQWNREPISVAVNVKAIYYMPTKRRVDLTNLHEALHDVLVKCGVLIDDNCAIISSTDGSRVRYCKTLPRTEITITEAKDEPLQMAFADQGENERKENDRGY